MTSEFWAVFEEESCKRLKNSGLWIAFGGTTESTGKCRFHRQAQNGLFDCAVRKFANGFAQDDTFWVGAGEQKAEAAELAALALMLG